jgi:hypothetical protein
MTKGEAQRRLSFAKSRLDGEMDFLRSRQEILYQKIAANERAASLDLRKALLWHMSSS